VPVSLLAFAASAGFIFYNAERNHFGLAYLGIVGVLLSGIGLCLNI